MAINVVTATDLRNSLSDTLDEVRDKAGATLIRRNKSVETAIISVDMLEDLLELHDKKYVSSIAKARREIESGKVYSLEEVFG